MSACECRRREQPWSQQRRESHPKRRYQVAERKMCQPGRKLSWDKAMLSDVDGKYVQQQAKLPHSFSPCLHLQTGGGVLARHRCGFAFEVWNSQNIAMEWRAQLVGLRNSIPCHGVHDLVKMCHLVNLVRSNNWAYVCV